MLHAYGHNVQCVSVCLWGYSVREKKGTCMLTYALHKLTRGDDFESVGGSIAASGDTVDLTLACCYAAEGKACVPLRC